MSIELFLIFFFLMYVGIVLLIVLCCYISFINYVDGMLVFGMLLVVMGL